MALFSLFSKKPKHPDATDESKVNLVADATREPVSVFADDVLIRESDTQKARRNQARMTAEKIDAIESEIARDILKSPQSRAGKSAVTQPDSDENSASEYPPTNLFHTTLIRVDKETMILFKEDMDD